MSFFRSVLGILPAAIIVIAASGCPDPQPMWRTREARILGLDLEKAQDPVSGRLVWKSDAIKREYKGTVYYFESVDTATAFDRDPTQFAVLENVPPADSADVK